MHKTITMLKSELSVIRNDLLPSLNSEIKFHKATIVKILQNGSGSSASSVNSDYRNSPGLYPSSSYSESGVDGVDPETEFAKWQGYMKESSIHYENFRKSCCTSLGGKIFVFRVVPTLKCTPAAIAKDVRLVLNFWESDVSVP